MLLKGVWRIWRVFLFCIVCTLPWQGVKLQSDDAPSDIDTVVQNGVEDGGRDNDSMAKTAILITTIVCSVAVLLCCGTMGFCIYQKCCVEECII